VRPKDEKVGGSLDKKGGRRRQLLLYKRWNLDGIFFPLFYLANPAQISNKRGMNWHRIPLQAKKSCLFIQ
jgi:hypothetical protein